MTKNRCERISLRMRPSGFWILIIILTLLLPTAALATNAESCSNIFNPGNDTALFFHPRPALLVSYSTNGIAPQTTIDQLLNKNRKLYLFRTLQTPWIEGKRGSFTNVKKETAGYSYSLNPYIADWWHPDHRIDGTIVVAEQSLQDHLLYAFGPDVFTSAVTYPDLWKHELTLETKIADIYFYNEVKVPFDRENALYEIPRAAFLGIIAGYQGQDFEIENLVQKVRLHPETRLLP